MTHKRIAELAHVSPSTVSKALSGSKEISEDLAQKIIKIAIENGYFKGKSKRKIENSKKDTISIAIVCPELISVAYAREITAFKNEIELRGGVASVYATDFDNEKTNRIVEMITIRNSADGIILYGGKIDVTPSVPVVVLGREDERYDAVLENSDEYMDDIIGYLKDMGHSRIGYVGETKTEGKRISYRKSLEKFGLMYNEEDVYVFDARFEEIGYRAVDAMMERKTRPSALVCAYDEIAMAVTHKLSQKGIMVPEDISVMGINDVPQAAYSQVPLTTVNTFAEKKGEVVVDLLYDRIYGSQIEKQTIKIKHKLVERQSVKKENGYEI